MPKKADNIALQLGHQVRILRKRHDITQEELATRCKLGVKHIQFIEGKHPHNVTIRTLQKIADGFDMPLWKLLRFEE